MPAKHGGDVRRNGFTLLEVVVAIALLAVVMTLIYGAFSRSVDVTQETADASERVRQVQLITERLVDELSSAYWFPASTVSQGQAGQGLFVGTKGTTPMDSENRLDRLVWTTFAHRRYLAESTQSDISQVEYRVELDADTRTGQGRLVREERVNVLADAPWAIETDDMAEGITEFHLRYLKGGEWADEWDAAQRRGLPQAVEVTVGLAGSGSAPANHIRTVVPLPMAVR